MIIDSATAKISENQIHEFEQNGLINHAIRSRQASRDSDDDISSPLRFAVQSNGVDSDAFSPTLWKTSSAVTHLPEPMSPTSRTRAMVQGRRELMEMIKDLPESFGELSLRDMVQICPLNDDCDITEVSGEKNLPLMVDWKEKPEKKVVKKSLSRSRSVENGGYLLKTSIFRFSFRLKKKKKTKDKKSKRVNVAPTPSSMVVVKNSEKEWWSRKSSDGSDNSGGLSSRNSSESSSVSNSASSGQGQSRRFLRGCCSFRSDD